MWNLGAILAFVAVLTFTTASPLEDHDVTNQISATEALSLTVARELSKDVDLAMDRNAIRGQKYRWPNGIVYYTISNEYSSEIYNVIIQAMREIERDVNGKTACIKFKARTTQKNYIHIHKGIGCHSEVGYRARGEQEVSIGRGCEIKGIVIHELLHALGFYHEQNRYDRDQYLEVIQSNVLENEQINFALLTKTQIDTLGQPYSFDSIMHYDAYAMAKDESKPVIRPRPGKYNTNVRMGQRLGLVPTDVKKIQIQYKCPVDASHIASFKKEMLTECNFENSMCELKHDAGDYKFSIMSGPSGAGPNAGNTNGADKYLAVRGTGQKGKIATFVTPLTDKGKTCLDYFLFQKGPSSYVDIAVKGPRIRTVNVSSTKGNNYNKWFNHRLTLNAPAGIEYQVVFEAHLENGDIGVDDFNWYLGDCI